MNICYIKESENANSFLEKAKLKYRQIFNIIVEKQIGDKIIYELPIDKGKLIKQSKINKIAKKINKVLYNNDIVNVALSNMLYEMEELKIKLFSNNINILNGRMLFNYMLYDIVKYILNKKDKEIKKCEISILVNDATNINIQNIIMLAKKVKILNIVTNNMKKFKEVEDYLYENFGIMIKIINNKKKSLLNSDLIINLDFPCEILNKYTIPINGIVLNLNEKIQIYNKKFNGININYYNIEIPQKYKIPGFSNQIVYESLIYFNKDFISANEKISKDNIRILNLIGNNGIISEKEFCN